MMLVMRFGIAIGVALWRWKLAKQKQKRIGDIHEECADSQPPGEAAMDLHNNAVGRDLAKSCKTKADCEVACKKEATDSGGRLQTKPSGTPPGNIYPTYPENEPYPNGPHFPPPQGPIFVPVPLWPPGTLQMA